MFNWFSNRLSKNDSLAYERMTNGDNYYYLDLLSKDPNRLSIDDVLSNPIVMACIDLRADLISKARYYIDGVESSNVLDLINNPNINQSHKDFITQSEFYKVFYGYCFERPIVDTFGDAKAIYNLDPSRVVFPKYYESPFHYSDSEINRYLNSKIEYSVKTEYNKDADNIEVRLKEIIPFYYLCNGIKAVNNNQLTGQSILQGLAMPIKNINRALEAENAMIKSNGREMFSTSGKGSNVGVSMPLSEEDKNVS